MNLNKVVWLDFYYMNKHYEAEAIPAPANQITLAPAFDIYFDNEYSGTVMKDNDNRTLNDYIDKELLNVIRIKLIPFFVE